MQEGLGAKLLYSYTSPIPLTSLSKTYTHWIMENYPESPLLRLRDQALPLEALSSHASHVPGQFQPQSCPLAPSGPQLASPTLQTSKLSPTPARKAPDHHLQLKMRPGNAGPTLTSSQPIIWSESHIFIQ